MFRPQPITFDFKGIKWVSFLFVLFLFAFESYLLNVDYSKYLITITDQGSIFFSLLSILFIIAFIYIFYQLVVFCFSAPWTFKLVLFLLFTFSFLIEYSYQKALGRFLDKFDVESIFATTSEQKINSLMMYFNFYSFIPIFIFLILIFFIKAEKPLNLQNASIKFLIIILSFFGLHFSAKQFAADNLPLVSVNSFNQTSIEFFTSGPIANGKWGSSLTNIKLERRGVKIPQLPNNYRPQNNVILVLDESVMSTHLSLNGYHRKTTPFLEELQKQRKLFNYGTAAASSTGSRFSYSAIMTGLTPNEFPDVTEFKVNTFPTIFQYAKAMNYTTYFFDGQTNQFWGGIPDDRKYVDNWFGVFDFEDTGYYEIDNKIAKQVNQIIHSSSGNFILIFKHGSHIPYNLNFPPSEQFWKPSYEAKSKYDIPQGEQIQEAVNAYDNSLRYNVDSFFKNLIPDYAKIPNNTVIVYTGDHGQTLFANGKASHGGETKEEASVPLFIVGDLKKDLDLDYKASHYNIYPTILDLFEYPQEFRERRNLLSLFTAQKKDSKPRFFNPNLGKSIPFD